MKLLTNHHQLNSTMLVKYLILSALLASLTSVQAQDLSELYEKVNPAVVVILTEEEAVVSSGPTTKTMTAEGLGSGFLISATEIITAAHVVKVAESVKVQFSDGETIPAKVISAYENADVALIELRWPRKNAVTVKLGDSDKIKVGQRVFVVGAPFGLEHSLSSGYISGIIKNKKGKNPFTISEYIQTDAAINHGNSGGPMFNMKGDVIGVVSQILSKSGGFQGIGFAASSNLSRKLLIEKKIFWSGMDSHPLTGKMARLFNIPQPSGLLVQRVVFLSPMGTAGLQGGDTEVIINGQKLIIGGDIILSFNGIQFDVDDSTLLKIAENATGLEPNDPFEMTVLRGGRVITLNKK